MEESSVQLAKGSGFARTPKSSRTKAARAIPERAKSETILDVADWFKCSGGMGSLYLGLLGAALTADLLYS